MKILFVYPDITYSEYVAPSDWNGKLYLGLAYLSASLMKSGFYTELYHVLQDVERHIFVQKLKSFLPFDLVAFSATSNMFSYVKKWADWTKETLPDVKIVCGGVHATLSPLETIQCTGIDMVCIGEGENTMVELCQALSQNQDYNTIEGLWVKIKGQIKQNPVRPLCSQLDSIPFPHRDLFSYPLLHHEKKGITTIMASRGCPYSCTYCCNHALKKVFKGLGEYVRFRSVDNVISEILMIQKKYPFIDKLFFSDDILPLNKKWFAKFAQVYRQIGMPYICNIHPLLLDEKIFKHLKESNCVELHIGIESGNEQIRKALNRPISQNRLLQIFKLAEAYHIDIYPYNIIGFPYESLDQIIDTIAVNALIKNEHIKVGPPSLFYPYPKTDLFKQTKEMNLMPGNGGHRVSHFEDTILLFNPKKRRQLVWLQKNFCKLVEEFEKTNDHHILRANLKEHLDNI